MAKKTTENKQNKDQAPAKGRSSRGSSAAATAEGTPQEGATPEERKKKLLKNLRNGRSISIVYFRKHAWLLIGIMVVVLSLMGLRYKTKTRMKEIKNLTEKLKQAESDKLREKKEYMTLIRQTRMNELVSKNHLGLIHQEQPPYEISANGSGEPPRPAATAPDETANKASEQQPESNKSN